MRIFPIALLWAALFTIFQCRSYADEASIRIGHFPNITHAQALLGRATGSYEGAINRKVEWVQFNAGPSAVESLFNNAIDATYIGPSPAINGFIRSHGRAFVAIAGSAEGGAGLVVSQLAGIHRPQDLSGKIIATPQLGNTQDVAARHYLASLGISLIEKGGSTTLLPLSNADSLTLFKRGEIQAVWTVEPWISRLEIEGKGRLLIDEKSLWPNGRYPTTLLVVSRNFLQRSPELVEKLLIAHIQATGRLNQEPEVSYALVNEELKRETGKELPPEVLSRSMGRVKYNFAPLEQELERSLKLSQEIGFLPAHASLNGIWDLSRLHHAMVKSGIGSTESK